MIWSAEARTAPGRVSAAGLTLVELLLVMTIIAVALGAVGLSLGRGGGPGRLVQEAERLHDLHALARAHASAQQVVWVLRLQDQAYQWQPEGDPRLAPAALTRVYRLPAGLTLRFVSKARPPVGALRVYPGNEYSVGRLTVSAGDQGSEWLDLPGHGPALRGGVAP